MKKVITVFGSSKPSHKEEEYITAYKLGILLGSKGFNVCTGGYQGIMDAVSRGVVESGGEAIGITVDLFNAVPSKYLTQQIECNTLFERIEKLVEYGDAFIILRGGTGTLLELAIVWELINKGLIKRKPVVCHGSMWKSLIDMMDERMLFENRETGLVKYFDEIDEMVDFISGTV